MNGRIYTCHHLPPERILSTSVFSTLVSGCRTDEVTGMLGDLGGVNIAAPNWHSEMRHQYHVWQERLTGMDYVGFEHYRRIFFVNPLNAVRMRRFCPDLLAVARQFWSDEGCVGLRLDAAQFGQALDLRESFDDETRSMLDRLMRDSDIVTQRPQAHALDAQFKACHSAAEWDIFVDTVRGTRFHAMSAGLIDFSLRTSFFCNMHIMRTDMFLEYMEFWFACMTALEERIEKRERHFGFFSERLLNLFVNGKRLMDPLIRVRSLPFVIDQRPAAR